MNKATLEEKLVSITQQFESNQQATDAGIIESHRLQGEYRAIKALLDTWPDDVPTKEEKPKRG